MKLNFKKGILIGCILIVLAVILAILTGVGIIPENDIGFLFAGFGIVIIGITILIRINSKKDN